QNTPPTASHTLSLHDALPIWSYAQAAFSRGSGPPLPRPAARVQPRVAALRRPSPCPGALRRVLPPGAWRARTPATRHVHQRVARSEEHTSELQSRSDLVCRLL